jgi:cbb3-type cytochrome oxidase subunit 3
MTRKGCFQEDGMSFKEIFSTTNAGLFSEIALVIFIGVFVTMVVRVVTQSRSEMTAAAKLPLDEGIQQEQSS